MVVLELLLIVWQNFYNKTLSFPVVFNAVKSNATLVPEKYFPQFDIKLQPTDFRIGDDIQMVDSSGTVLRVQFPHGIIQVNILQLKVIESLKIGQIIEQTKFRGERIGTNNEYTAPTGAKGIIKEKIKFESKYNLDHFCIFDNGWQTTTLDS